MCVLLLLAAVAVVRASTCPAGTSVSVRRRKISRTDKAPPTNQSASANKNTVGATASTAWRSEQTMLLGAGALG